MDCGRYAADVAVCGWVKPNHNNKNRHSKYHAHGFIGHYTDQGVLVQGHYEDTDIIQP